MVTKREVLYTVVLCNRARRIHLSGGEMVSKVEQERKKIFAKLDDYSRAQCTQTNLGENQLEGSSVKCCCFN